ncbi:trace amine-associated receptor 13c-like [Chanos chanos]|uniref:Trace amine-associated receptor 13c-like n=1 Tax=Chanos chanos TaxID=29144 RepID=A0A6J2WWF3_CHACN|nr:trace amine-associated receptor 13c-like [Chanos chanos]
MEISGFAEYNVVEYCFPYYNSSCIKEVRPRSQRFIMYVFLSTVSVFTVVLNLLLIISISHFKQLHTPTNLLILSLAVADLMVGLIVIPVESIKLIESCWYFGELLCSLFQATVFTVIFASLYNLVLIAIDRYLAICDPLQYYAKITTTRTILLIFLIWSYSVAYNLLLLYCNENLYNSQEHNACIGECVLIISFTWGVVDLVVSFIGPCSVVIALYINIFKVARSQVQVINSITGNFRSEGVSVPRISERKATITLGIVLLVFLVSWITHYICALSEEYLSYSSVLMAVLAWALYINSFLNPLIYAFRYPWFRVSVKHILTLKILEPSSSSSNLFSLK